MHLFLEPVDVECDSCVDFFIHDPVTAIANFFTHESFREFNLISTDSSIRY